MKDSELQIDRKCHVLYSKPCKKEIRAKIALHYPEAERETVWEKVQRQYADFLSDWRTDLGGKKNFHNGVGGTYDCIAILSYYVVCKAATSFREIEEMEENLILPTFRKLKFVDCNKPFWRKLMYKAFVRAKSGCDKWHDYEMSVVPYETDKPIYYEFTACPAAEFAIRHGLTDIMPALCNVDFASMELLHARLIRTNTCVNGCRCDYTICGDQDPYVKEHPEYRDEAGFRRNKQQRNAKAVRQMETFLGIMIPFLGTTLGAACVFFMKKSLGDLVQRSLAGFAAGVMVAASIWSLLIPAIEQSEDMGKLSFLPAFIGFWVGMLFLLLLDRLIPHLHVGSEQAEGPKSKLGRTTMMVLAVTLHNIPEGMAVGVVYAGFLSGNTQITAASALVLSLGIAIQNFPEGAIISMPLKAEGESKSKAFLGGVLSGIVEPVGAVLTLLAAQFVIPALPYLLSFAAGAMLYVVVEELIPEMSQGLHSNLGTVFFAVGFSVMMVLDVALG